MDWLKLPEFLQESDGGTSFIRVAGFLITATLLFKNVYLSLLTGENIELSMNEIGIILGALGIKAWQKDKESKSDVPK